MGSSPTTERTASATRPAVVGRSARTARFPVSRKIDRDQRVRLGQAISERAPEPTRLGEPVQEDQRRPRAAHLDMEWHAG